MLSDTVVYLPLHGVLGVGSISHINTQASFAAEDMSGCFEACFNEHKGAINACKFKGDAVRHVDALLAVHRTELSDLQLYLAPDCIQGMVGPLAADSVEYLSNRRGGMQRRSRSDTTAEEGTAPIVNIVRPCHVHS